MVNKRLSPKKPQLIGKVTKLLKW